jgi:hypothetical protein
LITTGKSEYQAQARTTQRSIKEHDQQKQILQRKIIERIILKKAKRSRITIR